MARTPEKLIELYIEWKTFTFPEWARGQGFEIEGVTTQDPATRLKLTKEGAELLKELKQVQRRGKTDDVDIDVRLCIDDCRSSISQLESKHLGVREILDLVAPDQEEKPWLENVRWLAASQTMPRALSRAQASGPWIKDLLLTIAHELNEAQETRDGSRRIAARRAQLACQHLANAVGARPIAMNLDALPAKTWELAKSFVKSDRRALEIALSNAAPGLLPESVMSRVTETVTDSGLILGLAEGWRDTLRHAVEKSGWAPIPPHGEASFDIMPPSRAYTAAHLRVSRIENPTVLLASSMNAVTLPMTIAHETYPGHLLQKAYQARALTSAQRLLGSPMSNEGWAHYAEMKITELGIGDPKSLSIGLAQQSLLRSARFLARSGIAMGKMNEAAVFKLFNKTVMLDHEPARRETTRAHWDHRAINYALGRRMLEKMEKEFIDRGMGDAVSFRMKALPIMSAPIDMIAKRLGLSRVTLV